VSSTVETATQTRPFQVEIAEDAIDDLRRRDIFATEVRAAFRSLREEER
jgi:hypothetical protein